VGSKKFDGVWFSIYSHDHPPPHAHGRYAGVQVIVGTPAGLNGATGGSSRRDHAVGTVKRVTFGMCLTLLQPTAASSWSFGRRLMDRNPNRLITDGEIDQALLRAREFDSFPRIMEATFNPHPGLEFLMLRLSDGRSLPVPREELAELKNATPEQAQNLSIGPHGLDNWWPQLDDGLYLPGFLKHRWKAERNDVAA
jgi:hypothetical protein